MQFRNLFLCATVILVACSSAPETPEGEIKSNDPVVITRPRPRKHVAPKKVVKIEPKRRFSQSELKPEPTREEKLQATLSSVTKALSRGALDEAGRAFSESRAIIGEWQEALENPKTETEKTLGEYYVSYRFAKATNLPELKRLHSVLSPCFVRTDLGGEFPAFIVEDYKGEADREEKSDVDLLRLDFIETTISKATIAYRRLRPNEFKKYVSEFLNKRAKRVKADRPIGAHKLFAMASQFKVYDEAFIWLRRAIKAPESEILLKLNVRDNIEQTEQLTVLFRQLTKEESKIAEELEQFASKVQEPDFEVGITEEEMNAQLEKAAKKPVRKPEKKTPKTPVKTPKPAEDKPTAEPGRTANMIAMEVNAHPSDIERAFKFGIVHYRKAKKKSIEQAELRKAQRYFDAAFEAWNELSERKPEAAAKLEARVSEIGILQYDIIKRLKL